MTGEGTPGTGPLCRPGSVVSVSLLILVLGGGRGGGREVYATSFFKGKSISRFYGCRRRVENSFFLSLSILHCLQLRDDSEFLRPWGLSGGGTSASLRIKSGQYTWAPCHRVTLRPTRCSPRVPFRRPSWESGVRPAAQSAPRLRGAGLCPPGAAP